MFDLSGVPLILHTPDRTGWIAHRAAGLVALGCSRDYVAEFVGAEAQRGTVLLPPPAGIEDTVSAYEYEHGRT